jgi:hypothetical protein
VGIRLLTVFAGDTEISRLLIYAGVSALILRCLRQWRGNVRIVQESCNFITTITVSGETEEEDVATRDRLVYDNAFPTLIEAANHHVGHSADSGGHGACALDDICNCFGYLVSNSYDNKVGISIFTYIS